MHIVFQDWLVSDVRTKDLRVDCVIKLSMRLLVYCCYDLGFNEEQFHLGTTTRLPMSVQQFATEFSWKTTVIESLGGRVRLSLRLVMKSFFCFFPLFSS